MKKPKPKLRWVKPKDMPAVVEIDRATQSPPWGEKKIVAWLKQDGNVVVVAEFQGEVLGYCAYQVNRIHLEVVAVGIHPKHQRKGVGRFILEDLYKNLGKFEKGRIACHVPDSALGAQLWLKACGFEAVRVEDETIRFARRAKPIQQEKA